MKTDSMTIDNKELNNVEATKEQTGQTSDTWQAYTKKTHVIGRTVSIITLVMLVGAPFLIGKLLGAYPDLGAVGKGFLSVGIVWLVSSIAEFLIYTPMLGAGGGYLAFITGNLINMKIPCAVNARDMVGAKTGTQENEIISTISIATSSLVTILVLALGVLLMVPLQPVCRVRCCSRPLKMWFRRCSEPWLINITAKYEDRRIAADPYESAVYSGAVTDRLHQLYDRSVRCHCHRCGISDVPEKNMQSPEQTKADPDRANTGDE